MPPKNKKLTSVVEKVTPKQQEVIDRMNDGWDLVFNPRLGAWLSKHDKKEYIPIKKQTIMELILKGFISEKYRFIHFKLTRSAK